MLLQKASEKQELEQLTLFPADFPVSHIVLPGSEKARQMTVTSGRRCAGLLMNSDPLGFLAKMLLESFIWGSTRFYLTWKTWGMNSPEQSARRLSFLIFRLVQSMPSTSGTGYGFWPTPTSSDAFRAGMKPEWLVKHRQEGRKKGHGCSGIFEVAADEFGKLPSPVLNEWIMGFPPNWTALEPSETP